jgi:peptidase M23-like protein
MRFAGVLRLRQLFGLALLGGAALAMPVTPAALAADATSVGLPFAQGETVQIIQGYNGGTHQGASVYGLDLVLADGETSGAPVFSPFDGSVPWAFAPGEKTGCIEILAADKRYGAMLCHVILDRPFNRGEKVTRGQLLGSVGAPGMVGNNGTSHVHMELHVGGRSDNIVPFSSSEGGLPLEGWDLPATGASDEHGGEGPIVSSTPATMAGAPVID